METIKHILTGYDVLPDGTIKPSALLKIMQSVATTDATNLGAGYYFLRENNVIFVITKITVEYDRLPRLDEVLEVRTWNPCVSGVSFVRNYDFCVGNEHIGKATSRWVLVSYTERRIMRPDCVFLNVTTNEEEHVDIGLSRRIKLPENADSYNKGTYHASVTDMDTNRHVNNTRYGDLLVDYSGVDFDKKRITGFEIHFVSELKAGEEVEIESALLSNVCYMIAQKSGAQVFTGRLILEDK